MRLDTEETDLCGVFPHMHQRGRKRLIDKKEQRCAADVQA